MCGPVCTGVYTGVWGSCTCMRACTLGSRSRSTEGLSSSGLGGPQGHRRRPGQKLCPTRLQLASCCPWPSGCPLGAGPVSAPPCILGVQHSEGSAGWPWGAEAALGTIRRVYLPPRAVQPWWRCPDRQTVAPTCSASARGRGCLRPRAAGASRKGTAVTPVAGRAAGARHAVSLDARHVRQEGQGLAGVRGTARADAGSRLHETRTGSAGWGPTIRPRQCRAESTPPPAGPPVPRPRCHRDPMPGRMEASVLFHILPPSGFPEVDPTPVPKEARAEHEGGPTGVVLAPWVEMGLGAGPPAVGATGDLGPGCCRLPTVTGP